MRRALLSLLSGLSLGCVTTDFVRQPDPKPCVEAPGTTSPQSDEQAIRATLTSFVTAVDAKNFEGALALIADDWRQRYSADRLARDFGGEPRGGQLVDRLRAALAAPLTISGDRASLPVGAGRVARIVRESTGWRIASLDGDARSQ